MKADIDVNFAHTELLKNNLNLGLLSKADVYIYFE